MASFLKPLTVPQPNKSMADGSIMLATQQPPDIQWESLCDGIKATVDRCKEKSLQLKYSQQIDPVNIIDQIHEITRIVVSSILEYVHYYSIILKISENATLVFFYIFKTWCCQLKFCFHHTNLLYLRPKK